MNWDAVGALAELLGAIGVVASLLYVAVQVRQNSRYVRGQSHIALTEATQRLLSELRTRPDIADINIRLSNDWNSARTEAEERTAMWWNLDEAMLNELTYFLWKQGTIDDETYLTREEYFLSVLCMPGKRAWWDQYVYFLHPEYKAHIDAKLAEIDSMSEADARRRFPMYHAGTPPEDA